MQILYFSRGNEYRAIAVEEDGSYRIMAKTGSIGKTHENFSEYFKSISENGWKKCSHYDYLKLKYKR